MLRIFRRRVCLSLPPATVVRESWISMPAMDRDFCLQVPANSAMYQESPSAQAFQVRQLFVGAHVLG